MSTTTDESVTDESTDTTVTDEATDETSTEAVAEVDPDAGAKKALQAERLARKTAEAELKALRAELASKDKPAEEQALDAARREGEIAANQRANERISKTELKAAAIGKLADPADALVYLNPADYVDDDGEVDSDAIAEAIASLLKTKPYLAAGTPQRFGGSADQGAKGKLTGPAQLTLQDLDRMLPHQIAAATALGQFNTLLGIKH
jgi:hypothetical protein